MTTIETQIALRELILYNVSLNDIIKDAVGQEPHRMQIEESPDCDSHIYIQLTDSSVDADELKSIILRSFSTYAATLDEDMLKEDLRIDRDQAMRIIGNADSELFFHLERSLKAVETPYAFYYVERWRI